MMLRTRNAWPIAALLVLWTWLGSALAYGAELEEDKPVVNAGVIRRFALIVGANNGGEKRVKLQYAGSDANTIAKVLGDLGGLSKKDRSVLEDPTHDALLWEIGRIANMVKKAKATAGNVQFIFYYSGHSDEKGLLLGGTRMEYRTLKKAIEKVPAHVRVAILDSCASGAFTRLKGGTKRAPFIVGSGGDVKGHAYLTSSSADEAAQESDRVGGSFFTHYFTSGLRGAADADGDKVITLSEAYEFAFDETLARTEATRGGAQHAAYDINLSGTGDLVLTDLRRTTARLELTDDVAGRVSVRRVGGQLYAELYKPAGAGSVLLALEPGKYQITLDDGTNLYRAEKTVGKQRAVLTRSEFTKVKREATVQRGDDDDDDDDDDDADSPYKTVHFNIGLVPALSLNRHARKKFPDKLIRNPFSLGFFWDRTDFVDGAQMALGPTFANERVDGAQMSMFGTYSRGETKGVQLSSGVNVAGSLQGAQLGLLYNQTRSGRAFQGTLGINNAKAFRGVQIGLANIGGKVKGAQIGLISYAKSADAQISLLGVTREHGVHPEFFTSDTTMLNIGLRFPAKHTYTGVFAGLHPAGKNPAWAFGAMFGGHINLPARMFLELDLLTALTARGYGFKMPIAVLNKFRLMVGWRQSDRLSIYGGPTLNIMTDQLFGNDAAGRPRSTPRPGYGWEGAIINKSGSRLRIWPGFVAGIRF